MALSKQTEISNRGAPNVCFIVRMKYSCLLKWLDLAAVARPHLQTINHDSECDSRNDRVEKGVHLTFHLPPLTQPRSWGGLTHRLTY